VSRGLAVAAGVALDRLLGEPPTRWHPVAWFGSAMGAVERRLYAPRRRNGVVHCAVGVTVGALAGGVLRRAACAVAGPAGGPAVATALATGVAVAGRMLDREAVAVSALLDTGDLDGARGRLRSLVGRRADGLDEAAISRAVIESVAENTVDAVTAAAFWAYVGGAPAVLAYRAINTMDAMVGHRNARYEHYGWAAARLDDAANLVPARLTTAVALAPLLRTAGRRDLVRTVRRQAALHPSPNGGLIEAAFAHRLGVTLGGTNRYGERVEHRGELGSGPAPRPADIARAVTLRRRIERQLVLAGLVATAARPLGRAFAARVTMRR